uniref:Glucuronosyltransferase n=1 Tax=Steinernema glaseri TaxID=37863 RepID=A0A1I8A056_9BILA
MMFSPVLCLLLLAGASQALKVLVNNPKLTHSHVEFQAAIADILADAGHTVVAPLRPGIRPRMPDERSVKGS